MISSHTQLPHHSHLEGQHLVLVPCGANTTHSQDIIHNDLKFDNSLLDVHVPYIMDFGIFVYGDLRVNSQMTWKTFWPATQMWHIVWYRAHLISMLWD